MNSLLKYISLMLLLVMAGCGGSEPKAAQLQPVDYFNGPLKVVSLVAPITVQASDLTISGVSRTTETITLNFNITITNSDTIAQDVSVTLSGRDRYDLEALAPVITATLQPGETRIINQQIDFTATLLYQVESWQFQTTGSASQPAAALPETPQIPETIIPPQPITTQLRTDLTDVTGTIKTVGVDVIENFRTSTNVNFSTIHAFAKWSGNPSNFHFTLNGLTTDNTLVYSSPLTATFDVNKNVLFPKYSHGEPLTIAEYDSITNWTVTDFAAD